MSGAAWSRARTVVGFAAVGLVCAAFGAVSASLSPMARGQTVPADQAVASASAAAAEDGAARSSRSSWGGEDAVIAVASEISPSWGESLTRVRAEDPEGFREQMRGLRRLRALAILKDRRPALYAQRIKELQLDRTARDLGEAYVAALPAQDVEVLGDLERQIREVSLRLVDANLRSRATELAELDGLLQEMRAELTDDSAQRIQHAEGVANALLSGQPIPDLGGRTPRGGE